LPGEPGYAAYLAYEDQQIAFWSAYAAGEAPLPDRVPNLNGARTDAALLDEVGRAGTAVNAAQGRKLRAIADYANRRIAEPVVGYDERLMRHTVEAEVGLQLNLPPATASSQIHLALTLSRRLPKTLAAVEAGELGERSAEMIAEQTENLDVAQCARLEDAVLPDAGSRSYQSLKRKVRRTVGKLDADAVRKRAEQAKEERCVYVKDEDDGMATLCIYGPAGVVRSLYDALNDRVHAAQATAANNGIKDERRIGAVRLDTIVDIVGKGLGIDPYAPPVPEPSFLTEEQIAALDKNANTYRPSEAMKKAVRNRDKHCRFPGCRRPARQCDVDHSLAFKAGGRTVYFNLGCVRLSHKSSRVFRDGGGPGARWALGRQARPAWCSLSRL
jgi:hypothetical protein